MKTKQIVGMTVVITAAILAACDLEVWREFMTIGLGMTLHGILFPVRR